MNYLFPAPWKYYNEVKRVLLFPLIRIEFFLNGIAWKKGWKMFGRPIIQKHRHSLIKIGNRVDLRSAFRSNPLAPHHPVVLCTWRAGAQLCIGDNFGMTGGTLCAVQRITIGNQVMLGANCVVIDADFHPLTPEQRSTAPDGGAIAPIAIQDNVFIGANSIILKGVTIGAESVIGAGSVVTKTIPPRSVAAGNPARVIAQL